MDTDQDRRIGEAIRDAYRLAELPWPPTPGGPIPLDRLIRALPVRHQEVPGLNRAAVSAVLAGKGVLWADIPQPDPALAGFVYANPRTGFIFVRRDDILPRRRFTAAHELGHYLLHFAPELARRGPAGAELVRSDDETTIAETDGAAIDAMEREANRFAAALLMPEDVCRSLHARYSEKYGPTPRFLIYHIAAELLVSRMAIERRLDELQLISRSDAAGEAV